MVKDEWEKIPQAEIDHLVGEEYRKRIQACIAVGGPALGVLLGKGVAEGWSSRLWRAAGVGVCHASPEM